jgi:hypothetical protein
MQERTILHLYPLFAVGLGLAVVRIRNGAVAVVLVALPLILSVVAYREDFPYREWDRWPDAVALAGAVPRIPVFVPIEAFALAFGHYCDERFGSCPIRLIVVGKTEGYIWSEGLSGRPVIDPSQAWATAGPVIRTIEWDSEPSLFPDQHPCAAADRSPAYRAGEAAVFVTLKVTTWRRRAECGGQTAP